MFRYIFFFNLGPRKGDLDFSALAEIVFSVIANVQGVCHLLNV